jgi:uncharacterized protein YuzE
MCKTLLIVCTLLIHISVQAQQFFVYDGEEFNILITCNDDNTEVLGIEFSEAGEWLPFEVVGENSLEDTKEGGFLFYCRDEEGNIFAIDYYSDEDIIIVHACTETKEFTGTKWRLERRIDE